MTIQDKIEKIKECLKEVEDIRNIILSVKIPTLVLAGYYAQCEELKEDLLEQLALICEELK